MRFARVLPRLALSVAPRLPIAGRRTFSTDKIVRQDGAKVFVCCKIPQPGLDAMTEAGVAFDLRDEKQSCTQAELIEHIKSGGYEAILCTLNDKIDDAVLDALGDQLKVVSTMSVGFDHVSRDAIVSRGLKLGNTPEVLTETTAELCLTLLLATARRIPEAVDAVKNAEWGSWVPLWMCGQDLHGSTVGIPGCGRIGKAFARRLIGFNCKEILYSDPYRLPEEEEKALNMKYVSFDEVLEKSDFVAPHCPLLPETTNLFNAAAFKKMKKTAIFINTTRGPVVDQDALVDALTTGEILAAGLDVTVPEPLPPSHPLVQLDNCVVVPHIASATVKTRGDMARLAGENVVAALTGKPMPKEVVLK
jgi:glyoxylate/hydroxypyruvate reductase